MRCSRSPARTPSLPASSNSYGVGDRLVVGYKGQVTGDGEGRVAPRSHRLAQGDAAGGGCVHTSTRPVLRPATFLVILKHSATAPHRASRAHGQGFGFRSGTLTA